MNVKELIELRKQAEKSVNDMPDGEIKTKAFEVILNYLISGKAIGDQTHTEKEAKTNKNQGQTTKKAAKGITSRLLVLIEEGFFKVPKSLPQIRDELAAHGWHYPSSNISPVLINLVQQKHLRRQKGKKGWQYTNY